MVPGETRDGSVRRWRSRSGLAAVVGAVLVIGTPPVQTAVLGTRPYTASGFDVLSLVGWLLLLVGLAGVYGTFGAQFARLGRGSVATTAAGMGLLSALQLRRVARFVAAGLRAVPATGEDPVGLPLTVATVLGLGLTVLGAGGLGLALRRVEKPPAVTSGLLVLAPVIPSALIGLDRIVGFQPSVGRLVVSPSAVLLPFGLGWMALGLVVWAEARSGSRPATE